MTQADGSLPKSVLGGPVLDWFALSVKPRHERAVAEQLRVRSVEQYVPLCPSRRAWSDRDKTLKMPLFPHYVFCRFSFEERIKVLSISSASSLVSFGGRPCAIPDHEIENIRKLENCGLEIAPSPLFKLGQEVRICDGPLRGVEGVLKQEKSRRRVVINVEILQRAVSVEVKSELIVAIGDPSDEDHAPLVQRHSPSHNLNCRYID